MFITYLANKWLVDVANRCSVKNFEWRDLDVWRSNTKSIFHQSPLEALNFIAQICFRGLTYGFFRLHGKLSKARLEHHRTVSISAISVTVGSSSGNLKISKRKFVFCLFIWSYVTVFFYDVSNWILFTQISIKILKHCFKYICKVSCNIKLN